MFDPYHTWLGIPPKDQPADHYRVLGLERFEPHPDVISNAVDRQMAHVRSVGQHHEQEQAAVLCRLAAARVCLLDPGKRRQYDQTLRETLRPPPSAGVDSRPPMPGPTKLDPGAAPVDSRPPMPGAIELEQEMVSTLKEALSYTLVALFVLALAIMAISSLVTLLSP